MKIGIITYFDVPNYGSVFLSYAMQKTLEEMGHVPVFLRYKRQKETPIRSNNLKRKLKNYSPHTLLANREEKKKERLICKFRERNLTIGDYYNISQGLDIIVVGSDQIFDCKYEFNNYQYAIGASCDHIISYAPSFGEFSYSDLSIFNHIEELKTALSRFEIHSARDDNTVELLENLTGNRPVRVLDPVLLYGFDKEKNQWNKELIQEQYLIIYTWGGITVSAEFAEQVKAFARKHKMKTVSVGDYRPWCDYHFASASPVTFFRLFQHSEMVITNMFHGTCFSILHEKPFYSLIMPHNHNKVADLLRHFKLDCCCIDTLDGLRDKDIPLWNVSDVNKQLKFERCSSMEFLSKAIGISNT